MRRLLVIFVMVLLVPLAMRWIGCPALHVRTVTALTAVLSYRVFNAGYGRSYRLTP